MERRFQGKVAIITGAAKGIGRRAAESIAQEGAKVVIADIDDDALSDTVQCIERSGGLAKGVHCDVGFSKQVDELVIKTHSVFKRVDILINNAGVLVTGSIEETNDEIIAET